MGISPYVVLNAAPLDLGVLSTVLHAAHRRREERTKSWAEWHVKSTGNLVGSAVARQIRNLLRR